MDDDDIPQQPRPLSAPPGVLRLSKKARVSTQHLAQVAALGTVYLQQVMMATEEEKKEEAEMILNAMSPETIIVLPISGGYIGTGLCDDYVLSA